MVCPAIFYQLMLSLSKVFPSDNLSSPLEFLLWELASFTLGVETEQEEREEAEEATACLQRACDPATFPLLSANRAGRTKTSWVCHPLWQQSRIHFCWCHTCSVGITSPYYSGFHHDRDAETSLTCCLKPFIFCLVKSLGRNELGSTLRPHLYKSFERFPDKGKPTELRGKQKIIQYCNYELQAWPLSCSMYLWKVGGQYFLLWDDCGVTTEWGIPNGRLVDAWLLHHLKWPTCPPWLPRHHPLFLFFLESK